MQPRDHLLSVGASHLKFLEFFHKFEEVNNIKCTNKKFEELHGSKLIELLFEILQELNRTHWATLWTNVKKICEDALREFALNSRLVQESEELQEKNDVPINVLRRISCLCLAATKFETVIVTDELWSTVIILHGSLLNFNAVAPQLACTVCKLCIEWWCKDLPGKESVSVNVLVHLLNEILAAGFDAKAKHFSKLTSQLYKLQNAFTQLDLEDKDNYENDSQGEPASSVQELHQLLISSFLHPVFLKNSNGRKFLAKILLLQKELMIGIHQTIMNQLSAKADYSEAYGNIYYLAWNLADEQTKEKLEECCIQDVMFRAVHANRFEGQFSAHQQLLLSISSHNGALPVRHMITRLYNPIIWRSLKANNAMVRANAASLLFDNFPLVNAEDSEDKDAFLQKQFTAIEELLEDPYTQVRSIAVTGMFNILNLYWDVIPAEVIAIQCKKLYTNLAFDSSSAVVRLAVYQGTLVLLNNPCSHPLLQKLLPVVGRCIHDASEKVRIAVVKVLLAVKQTSTIKFWEICPVENILAQLEVDGQTCSKNIVKLLSGSFLPEDGSPENWVKLCVNFYQRNTGAARKFYLLVKDSLSVMELGEFVFTLSVFIFNVVSKSLEDENQEQVHTELNSGIAEEPQLIAGLLDTICILWTEFSRKIKNLSRPKEQSGGSNDIRELAKKVMLQLPRMSHVCFRKYHDYRSLNALLYLSSCLHPASIPIFSKKVIPKLKNLPEESPRSYYEMLIKCVAKWDWCKEMLEMILEWLASVVNKDVSNPAQEKEAAKKGGHKGKKKRKGKTVQFSEEASTPRPVQGLKYLSVLVDDEETMTALLSAQACRSVLTEISLCLQSFTTLLLIRLEDSTPGEMLTSQHLLEAFSLHCKLLSLFYWFHNNEEDSEGSNLEAESCLQRITNLFESFKVKVVEQLKSTTQYIDTQNASMLSTTLQDADVSLRMNRAKVGVVKDVVLASFASLLFLLERGIPIADQALFFMASVTDTGIKTLDFALSVFKLLHEVFECLLLKCWPSDEGKTKQPQDEAAMLSVVDDVMLSLTTYSRSNADGFALMFRGQMRSSIRAIFQLSSKYSNGITKCFYAALMKKIVSAVLADISYHKLASSDAKFRTYNHFSDLPHFCAAVLPIACSGSSACQYICTNVIPDIFNAITSEDTEQTELVQKACIFILKVLQNDGKNPNAVKRCLETFQITQEQATLNVSSTN